jgi:hypothetical protein
MLDFPTLVDNVPTENSNNLVKSGGVYSAIATKQNTLTFDNAPTAGSTNPVTSDGIVTALSSKQDTLTFDNVPTQNSNNPVKSGGVYSALQNVGHTIKDSTDTFTQRKNLVFDGFWVEDDSTNDATIIHKNDPPSLVSWSTGTDAEIKGMVDAYYAGRFTLEDIKSVWSIGDERTISLSAMAATGVSESHRAQDVVVVILDFDHDTLTTPINGKTKALVSVQMKDCLRGANVSDTGGSSNTENGYMNSTSTNAGGWTNSARRTWCNNVFYNALPSEHKAIVKQVNKLTSAGDQSSIINTDADYCWFPSVIEIKGTSTGSVAGEGSQYSYYTTAANRYKLPKWDADYSTLAARCWLRSPYDVDSARFCLIYDRGDAGGGFTANSYLEISPAWAL